MKLIILDRDGVINKELKWVENPEEFEFIDGAIEAIANFKKAGYITAIATNQSHIDRGRFTVADLEAIHDKMLKELRANGGDIDKIVYCPSFDNNDPRRKPNPGMLLELLAHFNVKPSDAVFIGDYERDMQAGYDAGCHLILVENKHGDGEYHNMPDYLKEKTTFVKTLLEASRVIEKWEQV
ncbi:D-glycero-alpha-D-manno-heptose-1,7-bisphosphate 7-phosphatase [Phocoenobacter skyensis]|uniref:D,D-heptose 1,7-bisphosphate phosphatase n=1 Tax=Phocoenobacter skyensis TaxID=97481 RepID=A0ABT9JJB2_9PAST|nr:HAD-IIIA family hydrolase [Pasteurella skyensis]MDP8078955.1 HAD-IIIA family hydrolase [Pasteurella skyensis]MDP8084905.1 HAD-IIIA family hydrolase [Pasteurella skyensis]